jgi:hypothetical protein
VGVLGGALPPNNSLKQSRMITAAIFVAQQQQNL